MTTPDDQPAWETDPTWGTWRRTQPEPWPESRFYSVFDAHAKTLSDADIEATLAADNFNRRTSL